MQESISRLARVLGASNREGAGHDVRFAVTGPLGGHLKVSIEGDQQRFMCVLTDAAGIARCTLDLAPVSQVTEDPNFPGRVTLHVGKTQVHIDSKPSLAVEVVSDD